MTLHRLLSPALAVAALTACVPIMGNGDGNGTDNGPPAEDPCGAAGYRDLVGRDRSVAEDLQLVQPHRIYGPDEAVTMDYVPERINFVIGEDGNIEEVRCG